MSTNPFPLASGHGNFPNGVFSPDLYHKEGLFYFRQVSIVEDITTSEYSGEITKQGDTVHIRKQPQVSVRAYKRGTRLQSQDLVDEETTLKIDAANYYRVKLDKIMMHQADIDYESMVAESAAYQLKDAYDQDILAKIFAAVNTANVEGGSGTEKTIGFGSANDFTPLDALSRLNRTLTENNVPNSGRWLVAAPEFFEALSREAGKLVEVQVTGDNQSLIRDKGILDRVIHGFTMFETNNAPTNAAGNPVLLAGHVGAYATAQQILMEEVKDDPDDFGKILQGLHVYGDTVLRDTALAAMHMSIGDV